MQLTNRGEPAGMADNKRAIVLLSGGIDSATTLAIAKRQRYAVYALSFDYDQRHRIELAAANLLARSLAANDHRIIKIDNSLLKPSALTDEVAVPKSRSAE